jgi:predicted metal-dependent hydrolase
MTKNNDMPTAPLHPLLEAAQNWDQQKLMEGGVKALGAIHKAIKDREDWIKRRNEQIAELIALRQQVLDAYDNADIEAFNAIGRQYEHIVSSNYQGTVLANNLEEADDKVMTANKAFPKVKRRTF